MTVSGINSETVANGPSFCDAWPGPVPQPRPQRRSADRIRLVQDGLAPRQALGLPHLLAVIEGGHGRYALGKRHPGQFRRGEHMHVGRQARGLIQRAAAGQFVPELAPRVAAERDRQRRKPWKVREHEIAELFFSPGVRHEPHD